MEILSIKVNEWMKKKIKGTDKGEATYFKIKFKTVWKVTDAKTYSTRKLFQT